MPRGWHGKRLYTGIGRMAKGPGVTIKSKGGLGKSDAPVQVQQAVVSAMEGLAPRLPSNIDELYSLMAGKYGSKSKAAEAFARWRAEQGEVNYRGQKVGILPNMSAKEVKTKVSSQRREFERYIIAEDAKGAKGGAQARGKKLEEREDFRNKVQKFFGPQFWQQRDSAIGSKGVQAIIQGTLRIDAGGHYFERRYVDIQLWGPYWGGKGGILEAWHNYQGAIAKRTQQKWRRETTIRFQRAFAEEYRLEGCGWTYLEELTLVPPS